MNKKDIILIIAVLLIIILFFIGKEFFPPKAGYVTATVDGTFYGSWPLAKDTSISLSTLYGKNTFTIKDGLVKMTDADCPGQDCLHQNAIRQTDSAIICLPHRLVLEIHTADDKQADAVIR